MPVEVPVEGVGKLNVGVLKVGVPNVLVGPNGAVFAGKPLVPSVPVVLVPGAAGVPAWVSVKIVVVFVTL